MIILENELENKAVDALRACLEAVPFVEIRDIERIREVGGVGPDLFIKLVLPYGEQSLIAEIRGSGEPRFVREAAAQLFRHRYHSPPGTRGLVIAPFISPGAAKICAEERIGYVDFCGNCLLTFGQVFIERTGRKNLHARKRGLRSLYSPKAERVLRVLLTNHGRQWKIRDLSGEAEVSLGEASKVKNILADREWLDHGRGRIHLTRPVELLSEWAASHDPRRNEVRHFHSLKKVWEVEADLAESCAQQDIRYALTGFSGAARLAPAVRYQRASAYVDAPLGELASRLGLKEVSSGANVSLVRPFDAGVFYGRRSVDGVWIASPVQIYLDLMGVKGRGEEAARAIIEEVIPPSW